MLAALQMQPRPLSAEAVTACVEAEPCGQAADTPRERGGQHPPCGRMLACRAVAAVR